MPAAHRCVHSHCLAEDERDDQPRCKPNKDQDVHPRRHPGEVLPHVAVGWLPAAHANVREEFTIRLVLVDSDRCHWAGPQFWFARKAIVADQMSVTTANQELKLLRAACRAMGS